VIKYNILDRNFRLVFFFGATIYFLLYETVRDKIRTEEDLVYQEARVIDYEFKDQTGYRRNGHQYYLYMDNFPNKFQIPANFLQYFDKSRFIELFEPNEIVEFSIPKYQEKLLGTTDAVFLYSLKVGSLRYYYEKDTLSMEPDNSNYYLAVLFFIGGIATLIYYRHKKAANNT
jgi:hypothetical protein